MSSSGPIGGRSNHAGMAMPILMRTGRVGAVGHSTFTPLSPARRPPGSASQHGWVPQAGQLQWLLLVHKGIDEGHEAQESPPPSPLEVPMGFQMDFVQSKQHSGSWKSTSLVASTFSRFLSSALLPETTDA